MADDEPLTMEPEDRKKSMKEIQEALQTKITASKAYMTDKDKERLRIQALLSAASAKAPSALAPYIKKFSFVLSYILEGVYIVVPMYMAVYSKIYAAYAKLPLNVTEVVVGLILCFYGGSFPMAIAAYEALRLSGYDTVVLHVKAIMADVEHVDRAMKEDDKEDKDKDGIADVDQLTDQDLLHRKITLVLTTCNPDELTSAVGGIYTSALAVAATLKLQFAKTIALGASIGNQMREPANKVFAPILAQLMPKAYHNWINSIINTLCKSVAISIAYMLQRVISAVHSAIRGGRMAAVGLIAFAQSKGHLKGLDVESSLVDDALAVALALVGIYSQLMYGYGIMFPLSLLTVPLSVMESAIWWCVN